MGPDAMEGSRAARAALARYRSNRQHDRGGAAGADPRGMNLYERVCARVEQRSPKLARVMAMPATRQLVRYVFAGFAVTQFAAMIYSGEVYFLHVDPLMANVFSTACGLCAGYFVHSRWS